MNPEQGLSSVRIVARTRRRLDAATGLCVLFMCTAALFATRGLEVCRGRLATIGTPPAWHSWPETAVARDYHQLGSFVVAGQRMTEKYGLGLRDTVLYDPGFCPSTGVSLRAWFEDGPVPDYMRSPGELALRRGPAATFVVIGSVSEGPTQVPVVSFRRHAGLTLGLRAPVDLAFAGSALVATLVMLSVVLASRRALSEAGAGPASDLSTNERGWTLLERAATRWRLATRVAAVWTAVVIAYSIWKAIKDAGGFTLE